MLGAQPVVSKWPYINILKVVVCVNHKYSMLEKKKQG